MPSDQELPPNSGQTPQPGQTVGPEQIHGGLPPDPLEGIASVRADVLEQRALPVQSVEPSGEGVVADTVRQIPVTEESSNPSALQPVGPTPHTANFESGVVTAHHDEVGSGILDAVAKEQNSSPVQTIEPTAYSNGNPAENTANGIGQHYDLDRQEPVIGIVEPQPPAGEAGLAIGGNGQNETDNSKENQSSFEEEALKREFARRWADTLAAHPPSDAYKTAKGFTQDISTIEGVTNVALESLNLAHEFDSIRFDPAKTDESLKLLDEMKRRMELLADIESGTASNPNYTEPKAV